MIDRLTGGDFTKHDAVYDRNYIESLNLLSFWHQRDRYEQQLRKEAELRQKLLR
jgi:hypothetical protein